MFTENYNEDAHRLLADNNPPLAPALYHCMRVVGGLYMVVMECMSSVKILHRFFVPPHLSPLPDVDVIRRDLTRALDLLHGKDFVFDNLRPPNVLYSPEENRAFLIDFDWVGKHEEDRYFTCLNTGGPGLGVHQWEIMKKPHDRANLAFRGASRPPILSTIIGYNIRSWTTNPKRRCTNGLKKEKLSKIVRYIYIGQWNTLCR